MIYPHPSVLQRVARQLAGRPVDVPTFDELVIRDDQLTHQFLALHAALDSGQATPLARQSLLTWALAQLVLRHAAPRRPSRAAGNPAPESCGPANTWTPSAQAVGLDELAESS